MGVGVDREPTLCPTATASLSWVALPIASSRLPEPPSMSQLITATVQIQNSWDRAPPMLVALAHLVGRWAGGPEGAGYAIHSGA